MGLQGRHGVIVVLALALTAAVSFRAGGTVRAQSMGGEVTVTQMTASYQVELDIEAPQTMLAPDQAMGATSGEVMVDPSTMSGMSGRSMNGGSMNMGGEGQAVGTGTMAMGVGGQMTMSANGSDNHHLEVHIHDAMTGAVVSNVVPSIMITNQATGQSQMLDPVMATYGISEGPSDLHFGNNLHLDDGTYTISVALGSETAVFNNVTVGGGM